MFAQNRDRIAANLAMYLHSTLACRAYAPYQTNAALALLAAAGEGPKRADIWNERWNRIPWFDKRCDF